MKRAIIILLAFFSAKYGTAQPDTSKWTRAFPVTSYMVAINDSVQLVQVQLPDGLAFNEKQIGLVKGVYQTSHTDTITVGSGRCNLIKGDYYYFTISYKKGGRAPRENDLLYTLVEKPQAYNGQLLKIAAHYTGFLDVYDEKFYDRYGIFNNWTAARENACIDSMRSDIRFTGDYFLKNQPSMNVKIESGKYKDKMVLQVMMQTTDADIKDFLDYVIARPRLYAGREWKISEVFATWLTSGAPTTTKGLVP